MNNVKIKLCGFKNKSDVDLAVSLGVDFIGFVFHPASPRYVTSVQAKEISADIPSQIKKVAVLVDATDNEIAEIIKNLKPDFLQLHGQETPQRIKDIKNLFSISIIKGIQINNAADLSSIKEYENSVELFLFDSKVKGQEGGTGISFNWEILQNLKTSKPWFLAGGLNIKNIDQALEISGAKMIDVSSGIEEIKGIKSPKLIQEFMAKLKN